jgi:hypothetical protein
MKTPPQNKLTLEWVKHPDGVALVFDAKTWKAFEFVANEREQSAEHMILQAIVKCLGEVVEDNYVLNRILHGSGEPGA